MSPEPTIPDKFEVDLPNNRPGWTPFLISVVAAADEALQGTVICLASDAPSAQPDLMDKLREKQILKDGKAADGKPSSSLAGDYEEKTGKIDGIKSDLHDKNMKIDSSSYATFDTSSKTFTAVMEKVRALEYTLRTSDGPSNNEPFISPATHTYLLDRIFGTLGDVHGTVARAVEDIEAEARKIHDSIPPVPSYGAPSYASTSGGRPTSLTSPWTPHSNGAYVPANPVDGPGKAIKAAWGELERGVSETNGNNHINAPYNINDAWCASFTDWVWTQGGVDIPWTNKNLVSAVWSDAQGGLGGVVADNASNARPGDMIVWGDQGHIGLVVARNGDTITTIEGNSGDRVKENTYNLSAKGFAGVIHQPASAMAAVA
ncbi:CHAP domain-containing protein [Nocardia sp. KC 131]|uniref:CHAP domain-containing protein n=1 Tax=Nocardia arseniciresistens TaxID=3392119 RepID=UPI00398EAF91